MGAWRAKTSTERRWFFCARTHLHTVTGSNLVIDGGKDLLVDPMRSDILLLALDVDGVLTDGSGDTSAFGRKRSKGVAFRHLDALAPRRAERGCGWRLVSGEEGPAGDGDRRQGRPRVRIARRQGQGRALEALSESAAGAAVAHLLRG